MTEQEFTAADLRRVLRQAAGDVTDLDGDILDVDFGDLGYDSLALMETASTVQRERGVRLDESALTEAVTPRTLLELINRQITAASGA
jgi:act minimal PKS acyl carrier protein